MPFRGIFIAVPFGILFWITVFSVVRRVCQ